MNLKPVRLNNGSQGASTALQLIAEAAESKPASVANALHLLLTRFGASKPTAKNLLELVDKT